METNRKIYDLFHGNRKVLFDYFKENPELLNIYTHTSNLKSYPRKTPFLYAVELQNYKFVKYFFEISKENFQFYDAYNERNIFHYLFMTNKGSKNAIKILKFLLKNIEDVKLKILLNHESYDSPLELFATQNWKRIPKKIILTMIKYANYDMLVQCLFSAIYKPNYNNVIIILDNSNANIFLKRNNHYSFFDYVIFNTYSNKNNKMYQKVIYIFQQRYIFGNNYFKWLTKNNYNLLLSKIINRFTFLGQMRLIDEWRVSLTWAN